jgi:hypothetical protein
VRELVDAGVQGLHIEQALLVRSGSFQSGSPDIGVVPSR